MDYIAASNDRVVVHQAIKHLIVGGNALIYMGPDGLKNFPLNRFVVNRDGDGNVLEIVTKEMISKDLLSDVLYDTEPASESPESYEKECPVYTHVRLETTAAGCGTRRCLTKSFLSSAVLLRRMQAHGCHFASTRLMVKTMAAAV